MSDSCLTVHYQDEDKSKEAWMIGCSSKDLQEKRFQSREKLSE